MVWRKTIKVVAYPNGRKSQGQPPNSGPSGKWSLKWRVCMCVCINTCSAAVGSLSNIACAALLFLTVIAAANGVAPDLSLMVRLSAGWESNNEIIVWCWFSIATCSGVFLSISLTHRHKWAHNVISAEPQQFTMLNEISQDDFQLSLLTSRLNKVQVNF